MYLKLIIGNVITIYLNNSYIKEKQIDREYIDKIIKNISEKYKLDLEGYIKITAHLDINYGIILEIENENIDYLDCFNIEIENDIDIKEETFLYKIEDIFSIKDIKKYKIYKCKSDLYLEIKNPISMGQLIENSTVIYGEDIEEIKAKSKIIKPEVITCMQ